MRRREGRGRLFFKNEGGSLPIFFIRIYSATKILLCRAHTQNQAAPGMARFGSRSSRDTTNPNSSGATSQCNTNPRISSLSTSPAGITSSTT